MMDNAQLTQTALRIFHAGLAAVDPFDAVLQSLRCDGEALELVGPDGPQATFPWASFDRVLVVGAGKAAAPMCRAVEQVLGDRLSTGLAIVKDGHGEPTQTVQLVEAAHPVPDQRGLDAAQEMLALLDGADERTLVLSLLSGGGSALLTLPADGLGLADKRWVTDALLAAGADIGETNAVRKHLSAVKGGRLAERTAPATLVTLVLSDVVGDRLDVIASGPTAADPSTYADACAVLRRYGLWQGAPAAIRQRLELGAAGELPETPKPGDPRIVRATHGIIGSNRIALDACAAAARETGWHPLVLSSTVEGETREVARVHAAVGREIRAAARPVAPPACVISGGETTVTLDQHGTGGRNQEFALAAALEIADEAAMAVLSAGTDGTDGPTDAAGAIAFGDTARRAEQAGCPARRHLDHHDAYPLFQRLGDLIVTGPTRTNVMDIHLVLVASLDET